MSMLRSVSCLCKEILGDRQLEALHPAASAGLAKLDAPLIVAICGQLSAGKSTMVNALVGRSVAETGVGETTEVNWWFRRGSPERVLVRRRDGSNVSFPPAPGGVLPHVPDMDADALDPVTVLLDDPRLDEVVYVDAPGLFSPSRARSARAGELLARRTASATATADAVLYLSDEIPGARRDAHALDGFHDPLSALAKAPTNALLLLSRVDEMWSAGEARDPLVLGRDLLANHRAELSSRVWEAVPVIGLLAEAARVSGAFDERMAADLRALAADPRRRRRLRSRSALLEGEIAGVPVARRERLLARLGAYGLARAVELVDAGVSTPEKLRAGLLDSSGFAVSMTLIETTFRKRSELIRADAVLAGLERRALDHTAVVPARAVRLVRRAAEELRLSSAADPLHRLRALRLSADPRVRLPEAARSELRRLLGEGAPAERLGAGEDVSPAALAEIAHARARHWTAIANGIPSSPERRFIAVEATRACDQVARDARRLAERALRKPVAP